MSFLTLFQSLFLLFFDLKFLLHRLLLLFLPHFLFFWLRLLTCLTPLNLIHVVLIQFQEDPIEILLDIGQDVDCLHLINQKIEFFLPPVVFLLILFILNHLPCYIVIKFLIKGFYLNPKLWLLFLLRELLFVPLFLWFSLCDFWLPSLQLSLKLINLLLFRFNFLLPYCLIILRQLNLLCQFFLQNFKILDQLIL